MIVFGFLRRLLELHDELIDQVERDLSRTPHSQTKGPA